MCLDRIHDNLYKPTTSNKMKFFWVDYIVSIFRTTYQEKMKSQVMTVIRYTWYIFKSRS